MLSLDKAMKILNAKKNEKKYSPDEVKLIIEWLNTIMKIEQEVNNKH